MAEKTIISMKKMRIAIIPARGGSKRFPGKNLFEVQGIPLLAYTIIQAKQWRKFDKIYVNSDSSQIIDCAEEYDAIPFRRPTDLAVDTAKVIDVIKNQIQSTDLNGNVEIIILLPTCPLRTVEDIEAAYQLFISKGSTNQVISMTKYEKAPEQAFIINDEGRLERRFPHLYSSRSQDLGTAYRYNTAIIVTKVELFLAQTDIVAENSIPYIMPYERSIDIDHECQMSLVELIMKNSSDKGERNA